MVVDVSVGDCRFTMFIMAPGNVVVGDVGFECSDVELGPAHAIALVSLVAVNCCAATLVVAVGANKLSVVPRMMSAASQRVSIPVLGVSDPDCSASV